MNFKRSFALISTATLLAFSCSVVHADSARESKIRELDNQRSELAKKNGDSGYYADGRWGSLVEAEEKIDNLKKQVESLKVPYSEKNTIKVSPAYAKALKDNFDFSKSKKERDQAEEILKSESAKLVLQKDNFVTVASDEVEVYDLDNLPKDVLIELNYFAFDMINQVRRQMGTKELILAESSIDFASKLSVKMKKADRSIWDWHYVKGINEVAREYGLPTSSKEDEEKEYGGQYYENSAGTSLRSKEVTKAELKRTIYDAILRFLYDGDEFLHAQSIGGVNWGELNRINYFGFSIHLLKDGTDMSFILVSDDQISRSTKNNFSTTTPVNTTESNRKLTLGKKEQELESEKGKLEKLNISYKEYEKISKEINKLKEEEEKEKQEKAKKDKEKQNTSPAKPSNPSQNQDKNKPSQNQSKHSSSKNGWVKENGSWYYYLNGKPVSNQFQDLYYLKSDGKMAEKEWVYDSYYGSWFYLKEGGAYVNSQWYKVDGSWYYFKSGGYMARNAWQGSYYLKSSGAMAESEWIYDSNYKSWYYLKSNGVYLRSAWQGSYYLKSDGKMADKEWIYDSNYGSWFYLKEGGAYVNSQWYKVDGLWYYFKSGGYMARNTWQGSYYLKSSGAMAVNEWIYDSNYKAWYYLKSDGSYARNEIVQGKYRVDYSGKWI